MDQYNNNQQHSFLAHLLSNPADSGAAYVSELQQLVKNYPQSGVLQALLSRALDEKQSPAAVLYFDPQGLYTLMHNTAALPTVQPSQIYIQQERIAPKAKHDAVIAQAVDTLEQPEQNTAGIETENLPEAESEINAVQQAEVENLQQDKIEPVEASTQQPFTEPIEEEVYDEIVSIEDIAISAKTDAPADNSDLSYEDPYSAEDTRDLVSNTSESSEAETAPEAVKPRLQLNDEEEKLIVGNIAATDYFMFDKAFGQIGESVQETEAEPSSLPVKKEPEDAASKKNVSRYHDEQMPYTFLWWLDKTRHEYSGIYRPYSKYTPEQQAIVAEKMAAADALQQQYIENIFHLSSVESLDKHTADNPAVTVKHKGDEIIERFIKEEPQIKPPSVEKLDNENKAKRSSEDDSELVSETLANIYADQMLYHKAIGIYRKLMLKFPEKSRYFADRIQSLEKKTS